jgi:hypothetical protein
LAQVSKGDVVRGSNVTRARVAAALLLATTAGLAGCTAWTTGKPVAIPSNPSEPVFPTPRPERTPPTVAPTMFAPAPMPPPEAVPPPGETLSPNPQGYVYIETKSGKTRCQISQTSVGCEAPFTNAPVKDGFPANGVNVTADGNVKWITGNLGAIEAVTLDYRTYQAQGWTIAASEAGTRFTNGRTGHGMSVSIEKVESF